MRRTQMTKGLHASAHDPVAQTWAFAAQNVTTDSRDARKL
jgi:hypothetical protein